MSSRIEAKDGNVIMELEKMLQRWEEYTSDLFTDNCGDKPTIQKTGGNTGLAVRCSV